MAANPRRHEGLSPRAIILATTALTLAVLAVASHDQQQQVPSYGIDPQPISQGPSATESAHRTNVTTSENIFTGLEEFRGEESSIKPLGSLEGIAYGTFPGTPEQNRPAKILVKSTDGKWYEADTTGIGGDRASKYMFGTEVQIEGSDGKPATVFAVLKLGTGPFNNDPEYLVVYFNNQNPVKGRYGFQQMSYAPEQLDDQATFDRVVKGTLPGTIKKKSFSGQGNGD